MLHKNSSRPLPKRKTRYKPIPLFQLGQDLPLWTKSADVVMHQGDQDLVSNPGPRYKQLALFGVK